METRVEDLIEDYMNHYGVDYQRAVDIMIEDLEGARSEEGHR